MVNNPYVAALWRRRRNQRAVEGPLSVVGRWAPPVLSVAILVPLFRAAFLSFLDGAPEDLGQGMEGVLTRLGIAIVALLAIDTYSALIRGSDRAILDLHPVDAADVAAYTMVRVALERAWVLVAAGVLLLPVARVSVGLWALGAAFALGTFILGLTASAMVHLLAVDVAESERWAPLMELVRGSIPRAQAAFVYAPGVVLAGTGLLIAAAARGVRLASEAEPLGFALVVAPLALSAVCWRAVPELARRTWFRASAVLADIDARYGVLLGPEEARHVYLDWAVRYFPVRLRPFALKDLRHGWRSRRAWITGSWIGGAAAFAAGWTGGSDADARALAALCALVWGFAALELALERDEPAFLEVWLPRGTARSLARFLVLALWFQAVVWPPVMGVLVRHGVASAAFILGYGELSVGLAVVVAMVCTGLRERAAWVYGPLAAVAAAATAAVLVGGR